MSTRTVETATYDAWRLTACLSLFLLCMTAASVVFSVENEQAMRRCINTDATKEECLLTIYGR